MKHNSLECDHQFLNNICTNEFQSFQNLDVIHSDDRLKTCDPWLPAIDLTKILNLWVIYNLKSRTRLWKCFKSQNEKSL
jgi:hypothetical protein